MRARVHVWARETGELVGRMSGHGGVVNDVVSGSGAADGLLSASDDGAVREWTLLEEA